MGRGEQGVLLVEPYKSEILPFWRFKTEKIARQSAAEIYKKFLAYKRTGDFVGMDMARKFLQMSFTRARRYANHPDGRKYQKDGDEESILPQAKDWKTNEKARAAKVFYEYYLKAKSDKTYMRERKKHQKSYPH